MRLDRLEQGVRRGQDAVDEHQVRGLRDAFQVLREPSHSPSPAVAASVLGRERAGRRRSNREIRPRTITSRLSARNGTVSHVAVNSARLTDASNAAVLTSRTSGSPTSLLSEIRASSIVKSSSP